MDISEFIQNKNYKNGGLKNMGATCYINTLIQCLCSCSYFVNFILSDVYLDRIQDNNSVDFITEMRSIVNSLLLSLGYETNLNISKIRECSEIALNLKTRGSYE